jgi:hypothetical protein
MKITKRYLLELIREEAAKVLSEEDAEFTQAELATQLEAAKTKLQKAKAGEINCDAACQDNLTTMISDIEKEKA